MIIRYCWLLDLLVACCLYVVIGLVVLWVFDCIGYCAMRVVCDVLCALLLVIVALVYRLFGYCVVLRWVRV